MLEVILLTLAHLPIRPNISATFAFEAPLTITRGLLLGEHMTTKFLAEISYKATLALLGTLSRATSYSQYSRASEIQLAVTCRHRIGL